MVVVGDGADIKSDLTLQEIKDSPDDGLDLTRQKVQVHGHVRVIQRETLTKLIMLSTGSECSSVHKRHGCLGEVVILRRAGVVD